MSRRGRSTTNRTENILILKPMNLLDFLKNRKRTRNVPIVGAISDLRLSRRLIGLKERRVKWSRRVARRGGLGWAVVGSPFRKGSKQTINAQVNSN